jgi:hypothetical protein
MTLIKRDVVDVLREFESIKTQAKQLRQSIKESLFGPSEELENLIEAYKDAKLHFGGIITEQNRGVYLRDLEIKRHDHSAVYRQKALLQEIDLECDKAISTLESIGTPASEEDLEKLETFKQQLRRLSEVLPDINYEINVYDALIAYEKGEYLASALISSRVILYALDQIHGEFAEEKVQFLRDEGLIEQDEKDVPESLIRASRRAQNFFSYDITTFPSSSDALALLDDAMGILELISDVFNPEKTSA